MRKESNGYHEGDAYNDDIPEQSLPGDFDDNGPDIDESGGTSFHDNGESNEDQVNHDKAKTCPHYRQLTSKDLAKKVVSTCVPNASTVNCCSNGGDKSKFGTHDIEDLVQFGMQPNVKRGIAIYRNQSKGETSFGMTLAQDTDTSSLKRISLSQMKSNGAASREGSLESGDMLMSVNGVQILPKQPISSVTKRIKESSDPLLVDVYRGYSDEIDENEYSSESACPYHLSRVLARRADLIFCPYNYILDPGIRKAMDIDIQDSIIVLDEAHNVEDTLRNIGSATFKEFDFIETVQMLIHLIELNSKESFATHSNEGELKEKIIDLAHEFILLIEKVVALLKESKRRFTNNQCVLGVTKAAEEYERFKCSDDKQWEIMHFGPSGYGMKGIPIGCKNFFSEINMVEKDVEKYMEFIVTLEEYMSSKSGDLENAKTQDLMNMGERVVKFVSDLCVAFTSPEHYYISTVVSANRNLNYALGIENASNLTNKWRTPNKVPGLASENKRVCRHAVCNSDARRGSISHDDSTSGSTPRWEGSLVLNLLTPGILMNPLAKQARSLVLASGSLAPISSLCAELNLLPPDPNASSKAKDEKIPLKESNNKDSTVDDEIKSQLEKETKTIQPLQEKYGRLQVTPKPLEANHVISLRKQLLSISVGHFPDNSPLSVKMSSYSKAGFHSKLGGAVATLIESIPYGGVLGKFACIYLTLL